LPTLKLINKALMKPLWVILQHKYTLKSTPPHFFGLFSSKPPLYTEWYHTKQQCRQYHKVSIQYNADGIREAKTTELEPTQYIIVSNRAYAQVVEERLNNASTVIYTDGDHLLSQTRNGTTSTYHYDGLGSTRTLSDNSCDLFYSCWQSLACCRAYCPIT